MTNSTPEDIFPLEQKIEKLAEQIMACHPKQLDNLIHKLRALQVKRERAPTVERSCSTTNGMNTGTATVDTPVINEEEKV